MSEKRNILIAVAQGKDPKQLASELGLQPESVSQHVYTSRRLDGAEDVAPQNGVSGMLRNILQALDTRQIRPNEVLRGHPNFDWRMFAKLEAEDVDLLRLANERNLYQEEPLFEAFYAGKSRIRGQRKHTQDQMARIKQAILPDLQSNKAFLACVVLYHIGMMEPPKIEVNDQGKLQVTERPNPDLMWAMDGEN